MPSEIFHSRPIGWIRAFVLALGVPSTMSSSSLARSPRFLRPPRSQRWALWSSRCANVVRRKVSAATGGGRHGPSWSKWIQMNSNESKLDFCFLVGFNVAVASRRFELCFLPQAFNKGFACKGSWSHGLKHSGLSQDWIWVCHGLPKKRGIRTKCPL